MSIKVTYENLSKAGPGILKIRSIDAKSGASHVERAQISRWLLGVLREIGEYERVQQELLDSCGTPIPLHCEKCGAPVPGVVPNQYNILPEKRAYYREELKKLHAIEVDTIPGRPLAVNLHKFADLTPNDMLGLGPLIEWPPEAPETT